MESTNNEDQLYSKLNYFSGEWGAERGLGERAEGNTLKCQPHGVQKYASLLSLFSVFSDFFQVLFYSY